MKIINQKRKMYTCQIKKIMLANNYRKLLLKISMYLIVFSIGVLIALLPNIARNKKDIKQERYRTDLKYVLFWKHHQKKHKRSYYSKTTDFLPGQTLFIKQGCPHINCYITYNKSLLGNDENFDAVVFNVHNTNKIDVTNINLKRSPDQIYIFKSHESSDNHPICNPDFDDFFNWTWTYKLDSDIPHPFLNILDSKHNIFGPNDSLIWTKEMEHSDLYKTTIDGKKKAVAWLVTNCKLKNKHENFVNDIREELKGYNYTVDTFGPCSENKCPKGGINKCLQMINEDYFFNLVLEDSFADDYVTEKMVTAMSHISVPIVNGVANYSKFLPPGSYINARFFDIKKLGAILDYLIKNPAKYSYFFDWKKYYYYTVKPRTYICDLCTKLNENRNIIQSYKEFRLWWNPDFEYACQRDYLLSLK